MRPDLAAQQAQMKKRQPRPHQGEYQKSTCEFRFKLRPVDAALLEREYRELTTPAPLVEVRPNEPTPSRAERTGLSLEAFVGQIVESYLATRRMEEIILNQKSTTQENPSDGTDSEEII